MKGQKMKIMQLLAVFSLLSIRLTAFSDSSSKINLKLDQIDLKYENLLEDDLNTLIYLEELEIIQQYFESIQSHLYAAYIKYKLQNLSDKQAFNVGLIVNHLAIFSVSSAVRFAADDSVGFASLNAASDAISNAISDAGLNDVSDAASDAAWPTLRDTARFVTRDAVREAYKKIRTENSQLKIRKRYLYSISLILNYIASDSKWIDRIVEKSIQAVKDKDLSTGVEQFKVEAYVVEELIESFNGEGIKKQTIASYLNLFYPVYDLKDKFYSSFHQTLFDTLFFIDSSDSPKKVRQKLTDAILLIHQN